MKAVELIDSTCRHFLGWVSTKGTFINDVIFKKGLTGLTRGRNSITYSPLFLIQTLWFVKLFWNYCEIWPGRWNLVKNWIEWFKFDSFLWHLNKTLVETWILSDLYELAHRAVMSLLTVINCLNYQTFSNTYTQYNILTLEGLC